MIAEYLKFIIALTLVWTGHFAFGESQGGSDTGGGNVCTLGGKTVLLELASESQNLNTRGMKLKETKLMRIMGFDLLPNVPASPAGLRAIQLLDEAKAVSPKSSELIKKSLKHIEFHGTTVQAQVPLRADFGGQSQCHPGNTVAAVIYHRSGIAFISLPLFNKLDLDSQAALLIHETLRRIQITYDGEGKDSELQYVTSAIVLKRAENIDNTEFFAAFFSGRQHTLRLWRQMCKSLRNLGQSDNSFNAQTEKVCPSEINAQNVSAVREGLFVLLADLFEKIPANGGRNTAIEAAFRSVGALAVPAGTAESRSNSEIVLRDLNQLSQNLTRGMSFHSLTDFVEGRLRFKPDENRMLMRRLQDVRENLIANIHRS